MVSGTKYPMIQAPIFLIGYRGTGKTTVSRLLARRLSRESIDADRRPFTYRGEILFEGDQHAVYVFERARRAVQGKGV